MSIISEPVDSCKYTIATCKSGCHWEHLLSNNLRMTLHEANFDAGVITLMIGLWLNCTIMMSKKLRSEKGYRNLLNYTIAATLRRAGPVIMLTPPIRCLTNCIGNSLVTCKFYGFLDSLIAVYELESLTQVCIERLINAVYTYKGWNNPDWHNKLFVAISLLLALVYSSLPVLGIGAYGKDFSCLNCTFDILLPEERAYELIIILIFILKYLKPVFVMAISLNFTRWMELNKIKNYDKNSNVFSLSIFAMVVMNIVFWFPIFLVRSSVIMTQLLFKSSKLIWTPCFVMFAISMHWIAPAFAMFAFIWFNRRVRIEMLNLITLRHDNFDVQISPPASVQTAPIEPAQENKAQETKPQETKPQETKPQENKAQETKTQDTKAQDTN